MRGGRDGARRATAARRWAPACAALAVAAWLAACSSAQRAQSTGPQVGVASWYGPGFHGKATTSGEIYDQHAHTAAHRTWPLGTRVQVTNLDNGRVTNVRINDRGPFVSGRHIDLSYAAARDLGMVGPGTCNVRIEPLLGEGETLAAVQFAVQVASFRDQGRAEQYRQRLAGEAAAPRFADRAVYVAAGESSVGRVYRVRVGPYALRGDAETSAARLAGAGLAAVVVEENASRR